MCASCTLMLHRNREVNNTDVTNFYLLQQRQSRRTGSWEASLSYWMRSGPSWATWKILSEKYKKVTKLMTKSLMFRIPLSKYGLMHVRSCLLLKFRWDLTLSKKCKTHQKVECVCISDTILDCLGWRSCSYGLVHRSILPVNHAVYSDGTSINVVCTDWDFFFA